MMRVKKTHACNLGDIVLMKHKFSKQTLKKYMVINKENSCFDIGSESDIQQIFHSFNRNIPFSVWFKFSFRIIDSAIN